MFTFFTLKMAFLNYEKLFVQTKKIPEARNVIIIPYSYTNKEYSDCEPEYLEYLKSHNPGSDISYTVKNNNIILFVCFIRKNEDEEEFKACVSTQGAKCYKKIVHFDEPVNFILEEMEYIRDFISGIVLAYYKYNFLRENDTKNFPISILSGYPEYIKIYNAQNFVRFLGDTPANLMTPSLFAEYALKYCNGMNVEIFDKKFMIENNMNLLLGVANGSNEEPKIVKITYKGKNEENIDVSLVGKGITFDTGGISLKPSANMAAMKGDMLGAATVLATIKLANDLQLKINIEAVLPLSENMPGGRATKPGDVHVGMSGISVEVDNTDAEGRLILGDALTFAQKSNPEYVFDIATLTGAISVALGEDFLGYFCNNDDLALLIQNASESSSDPAWRMPLSSLFLSSMKSDVADLKNAGGRKGGSCTAAIFLKEFIKKDVKWCHFDIAGVDFDHKNTTLYGKGMTGRGFPLLFEVIKKLSEKNNFKTITDFK